MITYALDTNIISYMLRENEKVCTTYQAEARKGNECVIPPLVFYEVTRGLLAFQAKTKLHSFETLCESFHMGEMNSDIWREAAHIYAVLRKKGRVVEDADIFIAAFCTVNDYVLVTNNTKHFQDIEGLRLANWAE